MATCCYAHRLLLLLPPIQLHFTNRLAVMVTIVTAINIRLASAPPPGSASASSSYSPLSSASWFRNKGSTVEIDLEQLRKQGVDTDSFVGRLKGLAEGQSPCAGMPETNDMRLHSLRNSSVTCNDGTPAGYLYY